MVKYLLHHYLEETANKIPDKVAIKCGNASITYRDLLEKSRRFAGTLASLGFRPRDTAAIYLDKSIEAIIAMLGILYAGGAYIPLDSHYSPADRIAGIIRKSSTGFVVTSNVLWNRLKDSLMHNTCDGCPKIIVSDLETPVKTHGYQLSPFFCDSFPLCPPVNDNGIIDKDTAYILYTSGSTGSPKGVMLTHMNAITFINWALAYFQPDEDYIFSNFAPLHFDLSVFDVYVSIACGGQLELLPFEMTGNPRAIVGWLKENRISCMYSVPSVWLSILNYASVSTDDLIYLKKILFAGEIFPPSYLKRLMELAPHASFYNLYGPTETNVCTCYHIKTSSEIGDRPVPIGCACANTEVIALDENHMPVAEGEEGELYVRGSTVMKGYYKEEALTKAVFIASPLKSHNGDLLYRTGDIVRKCGNGVYEYIGRKDSMVKCSGFRIELLEIEGVLYDNEGVEEAVAAAIHESRTDRTILCAVLKMKKGSRFSVTEIKGFLSEKLPKYMIPEVIKSIDNMPKNTNGKVDRQRVSMWLSSDL